MGSKSNEVALIEISGPMRTETTEVFYQVRFQRQHHVFGKNLNYSIECASRIILEASEGIINHCFNFLQGIW